jgi:hypothetical protein
VSKAPDHVIEYIGHQVRYRPKLIGIGAELVEWVKTKPVETASSQENLE